MLLSYCFNAEVRPAEQAMDPNPISLIRKVQQHVFKIFWRGNANVNGVFKGLIVELGFSNVHFPSHATAEK